MRWVLVAIFAAHGLIHFLGFARAYGLAESSPRSRAISRAEGGLWLVAGLLLLATAALLVGASPVWWTVGIAAILLSQSLIISSWSDAKFGTIVNAILLVGVVHGFASQGPKSLRAEYRRQVHQRLTQAAPRPLVTEKDLAHLPAVVQEYLRVTGSVGQPQVHGFKANWRGRIRATAEDEWMHFAAEQHNFLDEPARLFFMQAVKRGMPVDVLHSFHAGSATMRVRLLSLIPLVDVRGGELDRAETVTLFNDLCLLAPAALVDTAIRWDPIDAKSVRAHYSVGSNTIAAVLSFNDRGELANFDSNDRLAASADGRQFTRRRWSTPVRDYRKFGSRRVGTRGQGRWHMAEGEFVYIELELTDLQTIPR